MKPKAFIIMIFLLLALSSSIKSEEVKNHYFDINNKPLAQYDFLYKDLKRYFGNEVPEKIRIIYQPGTRSHFDYKNQSVLMNEQEKNPAAIIGHESCHLSMANYTQGASREEEFRFFDEGFAFIFESMLAKNAGEYKHSCLSVAAIQNSQNNISLDKLQKWYDYFFFDKSYSSINQYSYKVASSFVYFIMDTYGTDSFFTFCKDIGYTKDLNSSFQHVFKEDQTSIESEWRNYLAQIKIATALPHIIKMFPENNDSNVNVKITEVYDEFDIPMDNWISIGSDSQGVSYKNAYWKTDKILAIRVNLLPNHLYNISLGRVGGNKLLTKDSIEFPPTVWSFTTGPKK